MLELIAVSSGYGDARVLHEITLSLGDHEILAVLGPNGAGKTTLLRTISRSVPFSTGSIRFNDLALHQKKDYQVVAAGISHVPEGRGVFNTMSVAENLLIGAYPLHARIKHAQNMETVLELFPELKSRLREPAANLSGGQQQMLVIGRALMSNPRLLLLDEPSLGLSPILVSRLYKALLHIRQTLSISILLAEQNVNVALELADRAIILEAGNIVVADSCSSLRTNPQVQEAYLGII